MKRFCLFGASPDTGNLGVSALCYSVVSGILRHAPDAQITVFDEGHGLRSDTYRLNGSLRSFYLCGATQTRRLWQRRSFWNIRVSHWLGGLGNPAVQVIRDCDAVLDISGGDSFTDLYGPKRFASVTFRKRLAFEFGKPLILLPQTYGPYNDPRCRRIASEIVRRAAMCWARDERSFAVLKELLGDAFDPQRHHSGVDVAFALEPRAPSVPLPEPLNSWLADPSVPSCLRASVPSSSPRSPFPVPRSLDSAAPPPLDLSPSDPCSPFPVPRSLNSAAPPPAGSSADPRSPFPVPRSLDSAASPQPPAPVPCSLFPVPYSPFPVPLIGFNVSGLIWHNPVAARHRYGFRADYREIVLGFLRRVLRETDANVMLVPHVLTPPGHYESDPGANEQVLAALRCDADPVVARAARHRLAAIPACGTGVPPVDCGTDLRSVSSGQQSEWGTDFQSVNSAAPDLPSADPRSPFPVPRSLDSAAPPPLDLSPSTPSVPSCLRASVPSSSVRSPFPVPRSLDSAAPPPLDPSSSTPSVPSCLRASVPSSSVRSPFPVPSSLVSAASALSCEELKHLISHCSFFCGTRMHACIAGLSSGIPTAAIAYSIKTQGVFATCGVGDAVLDPRELDTEAVLAGLFDLLQRRGELRARLATGVAPVRHRACVQSAQFMSGRLAVTARIPIHA